MKIDVDLGKVDIDQCEDDDSAFAGTHRCKDTTQVCKADTTID